MSAWLFADTFSGVSMASAAWRPLGWKALCFAETDPAACAVLTAREPDVPNLGDMAGIDWTPMRGKARVLVGGSPCTSWSPAGKREGLDGESGLMWEFVRAVREVRPALFVWENSPGVFSSDGGQDFWHLLDAMSRSGYRMAWRVLDARFFGVPQRRRRVFLVGSRTRTDSSQILFDQPRASKDQEISLDGGPPYRWRTSGTVDGRSAVTFTTPEQPADPAPSRLADVIEPAVDARFFLSKTSLEGILRRAVKRGKPLPDILDRPIRAQIAALEALGVNRLSDLGDRAVSGGRVEGAFKGGAGAEAGGVGFAINEPPTLTASQSGSNRAPVAVFSRGQGMGEMWDVSADAPTLGTQHGPNALLAVFNPGAGPSAGLAASAEVCPTIRRQHGGNVQAVAFNQCDEPRMLGDVAAAVCATRWGSTRAETILVDVGSNARNPAVCGENSPTIQAHASGSNIRIPLVVSGLASKAVIMEDCPPTEHAREAYLVDAASLVRRLTPLECERLMGLPDGWTDAQWRGRPTSDTARYRMCGNGFAVPVVAWIGRQIMAAHAQALAYATEDLTGQVFGELTVTDGVGGKASCVCTCGASCDVSRSNLRRGITRSCGHLRRAYETSQQPSGRPVKATDVKTGLVRVFSSAKRAAAATGVPRGTIRYSLDKGTSPGGTRWEWAA